MVLLIAVSLPFYGFPPLDELSIIVKNVSVVVGLIIGLVTYASKVRQDKFNNSFKLLESFTKHINDNDLSILRGVHFSCYEGCRGSKLGHFVTYQGADPILNRIPNLFIPEGKGLSVRGRLASEKRSSESDNERTCLGAVRLIAEQLNIIAFEVLKGQMEIRIVYYELSEIIEIVCQLLDTAMKMEPEGSDYLAQRFQYLLKMRKKIPTGRFPKRTFSSIS
jgi:hypothetical protein